MCNKMLNYSLIKWTGFRCIVFENISAFLFGSFRVDISDTLMYVYEMLGAELLSNLYDKLGRLLTNTEQTTTWQVRKQWI